MVVNEAECLSPSFNIGGSSGQPKIMVPEVDITLVSVAFSMEALDFR